MAAKAILGTKLGMTQVFDDENRIVPVTVVEAGPCTITQVKTVDTDGYTAVQMAFGSRKHTNKPAAGHLAKAGVDSARTLAELRLDGVDELPELGDTIECDTFARGETIDVTATSKGKGYAGVMKRHNFKGMGDGHGVKRKNRHPGSVGNASTPGRTFKGKRMAGRMGGERVTVQNLEVVDIDTTNGLILVKGAVPGSNGSVVLIRSAAKGQQGELPTTTNEEGGEA
ncbi:50S ribosomal protein L3 [Salsipaludibacter albus]|uniref:50S ribosomal protein L3 n=1 Tax=Salsipaludibacter albus TaxID=2849650 RepID=UPI001EE4E4F3|nr:50S ribosomal protein L3 [Salsipaludibacter albus]MBY5161562.1 50S ribosomal protein L3 [Salsipaludibacter albus]